MKINASAAARAAATNPRLHRLNVQRRALRESLQFFRSIHSTANIFQTKTQLRECEAQIAAIISAK